MSVLTIGPCEVTKCAPAARPAAPCDQAAQHAWAAHGPSAHHGSLRHVTGRAFCRAGPTAREDIQPRQDIQPKKSLQPTKGVQPTENPAHVTCAQSFEPHLYRITWCPINLLRTMRARSSATAGPHPRDCSAWTWCRCVSGPRATTSQSLRRKHSGSSPKPPMRVSKSNPSAPQDVCPRIQASPKAWTAFCRPNQGLPALFEADAVLKDTFLREFSAERHKTCRCCIC